MTHLHWELGRDNLLAKIDKHYKSKSVAASVGGAVGDMFGQAASAAALAMYDGEDTQNFACMVGEQVVWGEFAGAQLLPDGDDVKAVVVRQRGALCALSIMAPSRGLLWIKHPWGVKAEALANLRLAFFGFVFGLLCWAGGYWLLGLVGGFWGHMANGAMVAFLVCGIVALWANSDMKALAKPSTEVFRLLGFLHPERVRLNGYMYFFFHQDEIVEKSISSHQFKNVYCYQKAIDDGKLALI
ncbi:MAG TPA: hypothetical protein VFL64_13490 [Rhizobacter sp.]|nr:hypothetical protein [Rhizobacter sp.]